MNRIIIVVLLFLFQIVPSSAQDTLRIASYNCLKFPESSSQIRIPHFRTVVNAIDPDILVVQELTGAEGVDLFLNDILNSKEAFLYTAAPFEDGPDTDNMIFFKSRKFSLSSNRQIETSLREFSEYILRVRINDDMPDLYIYSLHLKAGRDETDARQRFREAQILRKELDELPSETNFFVAGDFNFYSHQEKGFKTLISAENKTGQCFDPINKIGEWHNNKKFAKYHTQSTRTSTLYNGSSGGLDDRFDFILVSHALLTVEDFYCLKKTYQAFGNDGFHMNTNINSGINNAVPDSIANALYHASDHLPVCVDVVWNDPSSVSHSFHSDSLRVHAFPNPFNQYTIIEFELPQPCLVHASLYNVNGKKVSELSNNYMQSGPHSISVNASDLSSGLYFCKLNVGQKIHIEKITLMR